MLFELPLAYDVVEHSLLEKLSLFPSHHFFLFFSSFSSYQFSVLYDNYYPFVYPWNPEVLDSAVQLNIM